MATEKLYGDRDIMQLDDDGNYYFKHVSAMTGEKLHSKGGIAAELGFRDRRIDELEAGLVRLHKLAMSVINGHEDNHHIAGRVMQFSAEALNR